MASVTKTSALVLREIGEALTTETINMAELQPNEALVEIHAVGVCHTDLSCIDGTLPVALPNVLGHEGRIHASCFCRIPNSFVFRCRHRC